MTRYLRIALTAFIIAWILTLAVNAGSAHEVGLRADIQVRSPSRGTVTYAHANVPANAQVSAITVTAIYSTGEPMTNGQIFIFAPAASDKPWQTGRLNNQGMYRFAPDLSRRGRWTIRVESDGHTNFINIVL